MSGPGNATFADDTLTNTTVTFDQPGVYVLRLTADDGLATDSADVAIELLALTNTPPDVSIASPVSPGEFPVGLPIPVTVAASDADGQVALVNIFADDVLLAETDRTALRHRLDQRCFGGIFTAIASSLMRSPPILSC